MRHTHSQQVFQNHFVSYYYLSLNFSTPQKSKTHLVFTDGVETHFAVNHLGHFLLTYLLLDKIKATATSRIVYLMNLSYRKAELNLADPNFTTRVFDKSEAFNQSQLANMLTIRYVRTSAQRAWIGG